MTINIRRATNVKAVGHHINGNSKPVFCITDGAVYASVIDAAEKTGATQSNMSAAVTGKIKTCKGKRYCFISNVMEHLDEIAENLKIRNEKVAAYDAMVAQENAKRKLQKTLQSIEQSVKSSVQSSKKKSDSCRKLRHCVTANMYNPLIYIQKGCGSIVLLNLDYNAFS